MMVLLPCPLCRGVLLYFGGGPGGMPAHVPSRRLCRTTPTPPPSSAARRCQTAPTAI